MSSSASSQQQLLVPQISRRELQQQQLFLVALFCISNGATTEFQFIISDIESQSYELNALFFQILKLQPSSTLQLHFVALSLLGLVHQGFVISQDDTIFSCQLTDTGRHVAMTLVCDKKLLGRPWQEILRQQFQHQMPRQASQPPAMSEDGLATPPTAQTFVASQIFSSQIVDLELDNSWGESAAAAAPAAGAVEQQVVDAGDDTEELALPGTRISFQQLKEEKFGGKDPCLVVLVDSRERGQQAPNAWASSSSRPSDAIPPPSPELIVKKLNELFRRLRIPCISAAATLSCGDYAFVAMPQELVEEMAKKPTSTSFLKNCPNALMCDAIVERKKMSDADESLLHVKDEDDLVVFLGALAQQIIRCPGDDGNGGLVFSKITFSDFQSHLSKPSNLTTQLQNLLFVSFADEELSVQASWAIARRFNSLQGLLNAYGNMSLASRLEMLHKEFPLQVYVGLSDFMYKNLCTGVPGE